MFTLKQIEKIYSDAAAQGMSVSFHLMTGEVIADTEVITHKIDCSRDRHIGDILRIGAVTADNIVCKEYFIPFQNITMITIGRCPLNASSKNL